MSERFHLRNRYILSLDLLFIVFVVFLSFFIRLEFFQVVLDYIPTILWFLLIALIVKPIVYKQFGLYSRFWSYASSREALLITGAVATASVIVSLIFLNLFNWGVIERLSKSTLIIDALLSLIVVGGVRFLPRFLSEGLGRTKSDAEARDILIVGAGDAGALVVKELQKTENLKMNPIAYLDDDPEKQGVHIHGIEVKGKLSDVEKFLDENNVDEVLFAIPSAPGILVREVSDVCRKLNIPFKTMPGVFELLSGSVSVSRLREINLNDLLRREHTPIDDEAVGASIRGKKILITGAGGSIASELCRQLAIWEPAELILVGHGENSIFQIMLEMSQTLAHILVHPVIADIRNLSRMQLIFNTYDPDIVFHAAAHKHVALMEINVSEAITNNITGTKNVVEVASTSNVERLVMISTDKAIKPSSVMGASKQIAEMIVLNAAKENGKKFSVVRFGNVLGSRGSVVPIFKQQIVAGGPVTVTHPDVERFFMTIPEAVHLVLQAFSMGVGEDVFLLEMGEPVKIMDLARDMIELSGLKLGEDIEIEFTGLSHGEKMSEELWYEGADKQPSEHPEISRLVSGNRLVGEELEDLIKKLQILAEKGDEEQAVTLLEEAIPGASFSTKLPPDFTAV